MDLKHLLKRGALLAAANWQTVAIQFVAQTTFQVLLAVPIFHEKISGRTWVAIVLALVAAVALSYEMPAAPVAVVEKETAEVGR